MAWLLLSCDMLKAGITLILLFVHTVAVAQILEGLVLDRETMEPVVGVSVVNTYNGKAVSSDNEGYYKINANAGDTLMFRHIAYRLAQRVMTYTMGSKYQSVLMEPLLHQLKEAVVTTRTKYQQDSLEKQLTYNHELHRQLVPKPKVMGPACVGCIGWAVDKIRGKNKQAKKFRKKFAAEDRMNFIDSRYNPELVIALTPLRDTDSIAAFIYAYPMESDFARQASDLELKSWVRANYKEYIRGAMIKQD